MKYYDYAQERLLAMIQAISGATDDQMAALKRAALENSYTSGYSYLTVLDDVYTALCSYGWDIDKTIEKLEKGN